MGVEIIGAGSVNALSGDPRQNVVVDQVTGAILTKSGPGSTQPFSAAIAVTTSGAGYVSGDVVGGILSIPTVNSATGRRVTLRSLTIVDVNGNSVAMNVYFFQATPVGGTYTDNAPIVWAAADAPNLVGSIQVLATNWIKDGGQSVVSFTGLDMPLPVAATTLFAVVVARGGATLTNGNLTLLAEFNQE